MQLFAFIFKGLTIAESLTTQGKREKFPACNTT